MTWQEFKEFVEEQGVLEDDEIRWIDFNKAAGDEPLVTIKITNGERER